MKAKVLSYEGKYIRAITLEDEKCGSCKSCSKGVGGEELLVKKDKFYPINSIIDITMDFNQLLKASFYLYGIPVILLVLCITVFSLVKIQYAELIGSGVGAVLIALYYLILNRRDDKILKSGKYFAEVVNREEDYESEEERYRNIQTD